MSGSGLSEEVKEFMAEFEAAATAICGLLETIDFAGLVIPTKKKNVRSKAQVQLAKYARDKVLEEIKQKIDNLKGPEIIEDSSVDQSLLYLRAQRSGIEHGGKYLFSQLVIGSKTVAVLRKELESSGRNVTSFGSYEYYSNAIVAFAASAVNSLYEFPRDIDRALNIGQRAMLAIPKPQ